MPEIKEIKELVEKANGLIALNREEYDEAEKNNKLESAEYKTKLEQMTNAFEDSTKKIEDLEKNQAEIKHKQEVLEAFNNGSNPADKKEENKKEVFDALKLYLKNGHNGQNFTEFIKQKGLEKNLLSTDSDPDGGYLVNPVLEGIKKTRFFETSEVRGVSDVGTTSSDSVKIDLDQDEAEAARQAERSASGSTDTPEIRQVKIDIHKYDAEPSITHENLQDSYMDGESFLKKKAFDRIARLQNTDYVTGVGITGARGLLTYDAWSVADTYEFGKVDQLESSISGDYSADDLLKLFGLLKQIYMNKNTIMAMNRRTFFSSMILKKNGFGDYLFLDNLKDAISGMKFLGVPIKLWDDMPIVAAGALSILIGDLKNSYSIRDKKGTLFIRDIYTDKSRVKLYTASRTGGGVTNFEAYKILKIKA